MLPVCTLSPNSNECLIVDFLGIWHVHMAMEYLVFGL